MKLLFRQRLFSWLDSYDIYDENGNTLYTVQGKLAWGHRLEIFDASGNHCATLQEKVLAFLPRFEIVVGGQYMGEIKKELTFFRPSFTIDCKGWQVEGDLWQWNYRIVDAMGNTAAQVEKQILNWTDTYLIDVADPRDGLPALLVVLAIDAAKCGKN